jgi:hypothetical protein
MKDFFLKKTALTNVRRVMSHMSTSVYTLIKKSPN